MGVSRAVLRRPLPPDLRKEMKAEIRKIVGVRADHVGRIRRERAERIEVAKHHATYETAKVEETFEKKRATIVAAYEAKAAQRRLAVELSLQGKVAT